MKACMVAYTFYETDNRAGATPTLLESVEIK
jgi:hypothetical protein